MGRVLEGWEGGGVVRWIGWEGGELGMEYGSCGDDEKMNER